MTRKIITMGKIEKSVSTGDEMNFEDMRDAVQRDIMEELCNPLVDEKVGELGRPLSYEETREIRNACAGKWIASYADNYRDQLEKEEPDVIRQYHAAMQEGDRMGKRKLLGKILNKLEALNRQFG